MLKTRTAASVVNIYQKS